MDLKATLKAIKLNEPTISTILGAIVVLAITLLLVNYFRSNIKTGSITPSSTSIEESAKPGGKHTVLAGEHLWGIAEKYYKSGYNWIDIAQANNLANANLLTPGVELSIPDVAAKANTIEEMAPASTSIGLGGQAPTSDQAITENSYSVSEGDHLWSIAVRAYGDGYQWTKIWEANKALIPNPNLIYPAQALVLPR